MSHLRLSLAEQLKREFAAFPRSEFIGVFLVVFEGQKGL
jgi:hypothetical protein